MKKTICLVISFLLLWSACLYTDVLGADGTLADAVQKATDGTTIVLQADSTEDLIFDKNITLDLNGFSVFGNLSVVSGCVLTVMDRQTDDYTVQDQHGFGFLCSATGDIAAAQGYLKISDNRGISFHKLDLELATVTLRPESVGIYYSGAFYGDEIVAEYVDVYGIALRLDQMPDASYMNTSSAFSWYNNFSAGLDGNSASGTLLKNVMRKGRSSAENTSNSQRKIFGAPYLRTVDGQYYFGAGISYSLMQVVQQADKQWNVLNQTQRNAIKKMYSSFESIIGTWYLPNINDTDIDIPI